MQGSNCKVRKLSRRRLPTVMKLQIITSDLSIILISLTRNPFLANIFFQEPFSHPFISSSQFSGFFLSQEVQFREVFTKDKKQKEKSWRILAPRAFAKSTRKDQEERRVYLQYSPILYSMNFSLNICQILYLSYSRGRPRKLEVRLLQLGIFVV